MSGIFGELLTFQQANGDPVRLRTIGDEKYARYENVDGYTVVYDDGLGLYAYATLTEGDAPRFTSTGVPISEPAPAGLPRHLKEHRTVKNSRIVERFAAMVPEEARSRSEVMLTFGPNNGLLPGRQLNKGDVKGLTILVTFPDASTSVTQADVDGILNAPDHRAHGNFCSVKEYFEIVSTGALHFSNAVVGPFMMSKPRLAYADTEGMLVPEAIAHAEAAGVDFSEFDSKGEGIVDSLCIMYAGRTEYRGDLWPHNWVHRQRVSGVRTELYIVTSMGSKPDELSIGTFCHEAGHMLLRFPDLYDYGTAQREGDDIESAGIGFYCVMGAGNHLGKGKVPAPVSAYLRDLAKWCPDKVDITKPGTYEARHGAYDTVMRYSGPSSHEYYLVENRSRLGLDADLPSSGLAVYHCDTRGSNEFQDGSTTKHYQCALLQADGKLDLERNRNQGDLGDLYAAIDGTAVSHATEPPSRWWNGSEAGLTLSSVSLPGEVITFTVGEEATPAVAGTTVTGSSEPDVQVPDNVSGGVTDAIHLEGSGTVRSMKVVVDVSHTFIGDLKVELTSPSGRSVLLHDRSGFWKDDLHLDLDSEPPSPLTAMLGQAVAGNWLLRVSDHATRDRGTLDAWRIEVETGT